MLLRSGELTKSLKLSTCMYLLQKCLVSPGISVCKSGFLIHHSHHWFGASPDGLIDDPSSSDPEGIIEFKNPYSIRMHSLKDAVTQKKDFCLRVEKTDWSLRLKWTHLYFYQIQATMSCTGCQWYDFVLLISTSRECHSTRNFGKLQCFAFVIFFSQLYFQN